MIIAKRCAMQGSNPGTYDNTLRFSDCFSDSSSLKFQ